jgi:hypothetical protein
MEKLNLNLLFRISSLMSILFLVSQARAIDTKRFDAPPLPRGEYLAFTKPINLRYGISPLKVDRTKLIMPPTIQIVTTTVKTEDNSSISSTSDYPLLPFEDDNSSSSAPMPPVKFSNIPNIAPPARLPLTDPFEDLNSIGIDSTDELLEVFESSSMRAPRTSMQNIPFVPPYTVAPDNMRVTNKATYTRRQR